MNQFEDRSDAELLGLEHPDAFAELYQRHVAHIYGWARRRVGDYVADLAAETFVQAGAADAGSGTDPASLWVLPGR